MIQKIAFIIGISVLLPIYLISDEVSDLITQIKSAQPSEKRVLMNSLKLKLRSANHSSRVAAMAELRKSFRSKSSKQLSQAPNKKAPKPEQKMTPNFDHQTNQPYKNPKLPTVQKPYKDRLPHKR